MSDRAGEGERLCDAVVLHQRLTGPVERSVTDGTASVNS